jgi:hypothetical protein
MHVFCSSAGGVHYTIFESVVHYGLSLFCININISTEATVLTVVCCVNSKAMQCVHVQLETDM